MLITKVMEAQGLLSKNDAAGALAVLQPLAAKFPKEPDVASLMSIVLFRLQRMPQAVFYAQRAAELRPLDANYRANLGMMYIGEKKKDKALAAFEKCLSLAPAHPEARLALANTALEERRTGDALAHCRVVIDAGVWHPQVCLTYAGALMGAGRVDEANAFTRGALERFKDHAGLLHGLCAGVNYSEKETPASIAQVHRAYGAAMMAQRPPRKFDLTREAVFDESGKQVRAIKVGFVSCDMRNHSVSFFIEPFFAHADRSRVEVYVYSTTNAPDAVTARLEALVGSGWRTCGGKIDLEIAEMVQRDKIDVLVDLGGHTMGSMLSLFAYKPAPFAATYCGYPNTTGLPTIDARIVDAVTDPVGKEGVEEGQPDFDERCSERVVRMDDGEGGRGCFLCYRPMADAPEPVRVREAGDASITFASFNANKKIGPGSVALWAQVMREVPGSRMLLKTFELKDPAAKERIVGLFDQQGIDASRLTILPATATLREHLEVYSRVDIALDTSPYNGTTTTCEALWMGVPVVTLCGRVHAARVSASLLTAIGATELIAHDAGAFVRVARELAGDAGRLAEYRAGLRGKMKGSGLCDEVEFARRFEGVLVGVVRGE